MSRSWMRMTLTVAAVAAGCQAQMETADDDTGEDGTVVVPDASTGRTPGQAPAPGRDAEVAADRAPAATAPARDVGADAGAAADRVPDATAAVAAGVPRPLDVNVLHEILIEATAEQWMAVISVPHRTSARHPIDITFDGVKLPMTGARIKGNYGSRSTSKPGLSIKFDQFVPGQKLHGLDKIILNNARQDNTFLREHLSYELYRMANMWAPLTAYGIVTLKIAGQAPRVLGLYVVKEALDKDFLRRNFGNASGNLYEGDIVDFVLQPTATGFLTLKNEKEEMRSRADIIKAAGVIRNTPVETWENAVDGVIDLKQFVSGFALDAIIGFWDAYWYGMNNYFLYNNPKDGRFVYVPHGPDSVFCTVGAWPQPPNYCKLEPTVDPFVPLNAVNMGMRNGFLAKRIRAIPAMDQKWRAEVGRLAREVWDVAKLQARVDQAEKVITSAKVQHADIDRFKMNLPLLRDYIVKRKAFVESVAR